MKYASRTAIDVGVLQTLLDACVAQRALTGGHCPGCQCGGVEPIDRIIARVQKHLADGVALEWSDRSIVVPDNIFAVADAIISCALDHHYDRGEGVPWGLSAAERAACLPVVARHLAAVNLDWEEHTVDLDETQSTALFADLVAALIRAGSSRPTCAPQAENVK